MKFLELLIVQKPGLNEHWWHRLANILIYGSTILLAILVLGIAYNDPSWKLHQYTYSFEKDYSAAMGKVEGCSFYGYDKSSTIFCGDLNTASEFLTRYTNARGTYKEYFEQRAKLGYTDEQMLNGANDSGKFDDVQVKDHEIPQLNLLLKQIGLAVLVILAWFIFWQSIVYRAIVYVALGKKHT